MPRLSRILLVGLTIFVAPRFARSSDVSPKDATLKDHIAPLLARYCTDCHGPEKPKGRLDLTAFSAEDSIQGRRKAWGLIRDYIESGEMPPEDRDQPSPEEVDLLVRWIDSRLAQSNCQGQVDPGRVTLRRLNRTEYNNTIRDLLGVDFQPADDFPSDDVGYGFDNIGDVLTLPPILMERYLAAAEQIVNKAIVADLEKPMLVRRWELDATLASHSEVGGKQAIPAAGSYRIQARAYGDQAGPEKARMAFLVDGRKLEEVEVPAVEASPGEYSVEVDLTPGEHEFAVAFTNDYYKEDDPDPANRDRNLHVLTLAVLSARAIPELLPESHTRLIAKRPSAGETPAEIAGDLLQRFASRAYRRPARNEEIARLVSLVEMVLKDGGTFEEGMQLAVQAALVSPHFLFRVEVDRRRNLKGNVQDLNDFELASRLSYFLWSSMPDEELDSLARKGNLRQPEMLEAQARRMLRDPKARALVENFGGQWLQIRNLKAFNPDPQRFPGFDEPLRQAMQRETELFFNEIVTADRSVLEFLDADYTFVNERLARHYGMDHVTGEEFRKVQLTDGRRGGILTQASILAVTSNPTRTSPVKRGKWILEQVLGTPPPPPPPNVPELKEDNDAVLTGSLRQRMEQHRADPNCATCHAKMDPLGFGFENYDPTGAWRDRDGEFAVDPSGVVPWGASFQGPAELKRLLLDTKSKAFLECLTEKMLTYALGRGLDANDQCVVESIAASLPRDGHKFSRLVVEIVKSDPFRKRNVGGDR